MEGRTNLLQPMNDGENIFSSTLGLRLIVIIFYVHILKQKYGHNLHKLRKKIPLKSSPLPRAGQAVKDDARGKSTGRRAGNRKTSDFLNVAVTKLCDCATFCHLSNLEIP